MNILLTGASSGIGLATLKKLLPKHSITALCRTKPSIEDPSLTYHPFDLEKENDYPQLARCYPHIDTLILSAGIGHFGHLEELNPTKMEKVMQINFLSQALLIKAFLPQLKQKEKAHIIIIGSEAALQGKKRSSIYAASKFAFRGFAQSLAEECLGSNIAITTIQAGLVKTPFYDDLPFTPSNKEKASLMPEDIAEATDWILSQPARVFYPEILLYPKKNEVIWKSRREELSSAF